MLILQNSPFESIDLAGLTYMGSSGLVAIHSIALLLRGQELLSAARRPLAAISNARA